MVEAAEEDQIVDVCRPFVYPVDDVMGMDEYGPPAAREPASSVAVLQQPAKPPGHRPGAPSHAEGIVLVVDDTLDDRVAGEASGRLVGEQ